METLFQKFGKTLIIAAIILIVIPSFLVRCTLVDSSEIGIKFNKLALTDSGTLKAINCSGYILYCPIVTDVYTYERRVRQVSYDAFEVKTNDGIVFTMDPKLSYHLIKEKAVDVFAKYRVSLKSIEDGYMLNAIYRAYRMNASKFTADGLMANQEQFETMVEDMLRETLGNEGFYVEQFTSKIDPPESMKKAIEAKTAAVQDALKAENEVKKAEADAKIAIANAEGAAKAMRVKADAEAYYNMKLSASLTDKIVAEDWIEKWDGKLPSVQGGNGMMPIINLGQK